MATIKEQDIVLVSKEPDGTKVIQMPITRVENVEGGIATINGIKPDTSKNVTITSVANATNASHANTANTANSATNATHATNADNAVKANQDSAGNVINTTYASVSALNALISRVSAIESKYVTKTNPTVSGTLTIEG